LPVSNGEDDPLFCDAVLGLERGDFSRLANLFKDDPSLHHKCRIVAWYEAGFFDGEPKALNEALTCACFNGRTRVADYLLKRGVDPAAGANTGLNAFHWAANRGQLDTVKLLIAARSPLEIKNTYGGTVLGTAVWSAINEPRADHLAIIEALIAAGANLDGAGYPTRNESLDELLRRHGAGA
jgi:hypothetical protein